MSLEIIHGDITKIQTDAIVNAANSHLLAGGGVCGAIFSAAGINELQTACERIGYCKQGEAVITDAYKLPSKYIIHTVGPIWQGGSHGEEKILRACYRKSLELAEKYGINSIAFPLISSGIFGYPKEMALSVAISEIEDYLNKREIKVFLVLFDK